MRGLFGDFATMPLRDLVVYLGNRKATGILSLQRDVVRKQVIVEAGELVNASSNEPREYLGQFLINLGHITEEQFNRAYQTQKETQIFLGKILVMIGAVKEEAVMAALSLKMRETLLEAYQWQSGTFAFEADKRPDVPPGVELKIPLAEISQEGEFRETVWRAIRGVFPKGSCTLRLDRSKLAEPPRPGSLDEKLYGLIEASHSIDEIVLALHATDFFLHQRLYALHRLEAVQVAGDGSLDLEMAGIDKPLEVGGSEGADLQQHVKDFLEQGNYRDALALARRLNEMTPSESALATVQDIEAKWLPLLRQQLLGKKQVASLKVPPSKLKSLSLSAPERYLLSRVDGSRDLQSIVAVSPLRELEVLAHLQRFIELELISVT